MSSKGRQVRDRLLSAARLLMEIAPDTPPTLTAVTAEAGVNITIVYRYYADAGALLFDAMQPLREEIAPLAAMLQAPWAKGSEHECALAFAHAHYEYWHARRGALFVRNTLAERGDSRFIQLRAQWPTALFHGLAAKLAAAHGRAGIEADLPIAGILISGLERTTTLLLQNAGRRTARQPRVVEQQQAIAQLITTLLRHDPLAN